MPESLVVSPTSAPWLESCLARFHQIGVLRQFPGVRVVPPTLRFGNALHGVLRDLYDPKKPGSLPHTDRLDSIIHFAFLRAGYNDDQDRAYEMERGRKVILAYLRDSDLTDSESTVGVEVSGSWPVTVAGEVLYTLSAKLDRVLIMPDKTAVGIDYKTGASLPPISGVLVNLAALKASYPDAKGYEFWIESLSDGGTERTVYKSTDFKGAVKGLTAQVRRYLSSAEYPEEPSDGCAWCPLNATCSKAGGQAAISAEELEF